MSSGPSRKPASTQRGRAFDDFLVTGMGWTNTFISRAVIPEGLVGYERVSPLEMLYPDNDKINLVCRIMAAHAGVGVRRG